MKLENCRVYVGYILFVLISKSQNERDAHHDVSNERKFATCSPLYAFFMFSGLVWRLFQSMTELAIKDLI